MKKQSSFYYIIIAGLYLVGQIGIYIYAYIYKLQEEMGFSIFTNVSALVWGLFASLVFLSVVYEYGISTTPGKIWFFLMLGFFGWWGGDLIWAIYDVVLQQEELFPSPADYVYLLGYLFLYGAILSQLRQFSTRLTNRERWIIVGIVLAIFLVVLIVLIVPMIQTPINEDFTIIQLFFSLFYPIADLVLLAICLSFFFKLSGGEYAKSWRIIAIGFFIYIIVDFLFVWFEWQEIPLAFMIYDHFYVLCSMIFAGGALYTREILRKISV